MACTCCDCQEPLEILDDVAIRIKQTDRLKASLDYLATAKGGWVKLYRCKECGQFWQSSTYETGVAHFYEVLYPVPPIDLQEWLEHPYLDAVQIAENRTKIMRVENELGPEIGPELCRIEDCHRLRVAHSVFCQQHHIENLQKIGALPQLPAINNDAGLSLNSQPLGCPVGVVVP